MTGNEPQPPPLQGIHHLKLPVSDLDTSLTFYERAFGARRIPEADHRRASDGSASAQAASATMSFSATAWSITGRRPPRRALVCPWSRSRGR